MGERRHEERPGHLPGRDRQRRRRRDRVHRLHPGPGVERLQPRSGSALAAVVPDAVRARRVHHRGRGAAARRSSTSGTASAPTIGRRRGRTSRAAAYNPVPMSLPAQRAADGLDLTALEAITDAVESGRGAARGRARRRARARRQPRAGRPRGHACSPSAARSPADERSLVAGGAGVETLELRVADEPVGDAADARARSEPGAALLRLVTTLVASEVERVRAPERASEEALAGFLRAIMARELDAIATTSSRAPRSSASTSTRAPCVVVARAHSARRRPRTAGAQRVLAVAERGARAVASRAVAALGERDDRPGAEVVVLVPGADDALAARAAEARRRASCRPRCRATRSRSAAAASPRTRSTCHRAASEALLAANVAEGDAERPGARLRGDRRVPAAALGDERGPRRAAALLRRDGRAARRLRRAVRDRPRADGRGVPRRGRQRRRDRRSGCSRTATRSATASSACASSPASTSARPTAARS